MEWVDGARWEKPSWTFKYNPKKQLVSPPPSLVTLLMDLQVHVSQNKVHVCQRFEHQSCMSVSLAGHSGGQQVLCTQVALWHTAATPQSEAAHNHLQHDTLLRESSWEMSCSCLSLLAHVSCGDGGSTLKRAETLFAAAQNTWLTLVFPQAQTHHLWLNYN